MQRELYISLDEYLASDEMNEYREEINSFKKQNLLEEEEFNIEDINYLEVINYPISWGIKTMNEVLGGQPQGKFMMLYGGPGSGKCHGLGTEILMYDGQIKKVEDIKVGEQIMGDDSTPRNVLSLAKGKEEMFEIKPYSGMNIFTINKSHMLTLKNTSNTRTEGKSKGYIGDIKFAEYINKSKKYKKANRLYKVGWNFNKNKELKVNPYLLGLWLGDGDTNASVISTIDVEIKEYLYNYCKDNGYKIYNKETREGKCPRYAISNIKKDNLQSTLRKIGVLGNKYIPNEYLYSSKKERREILAGLIDSDGSISGRGYEITQKSRTLIYNIKYICDSLGYKTKVTKLKKGIKSINFIGTYYRLGINGNGLKELPVLLERKKINAEIYTDSSASGFTYTSLGEGDYYGFQLDGNHRYLLGDGIVTHNTTLSLQIAIDNQGLSNNVCYLSFEMPKKDFIVQNMRTRAGLKQSGVGQSVLPTATQQGTMKAFIKSIKDIDIKGYVKQPSFKEFMDIMNSIKTKKYSQVIIDNLGMIGRADGKDEMLLYGMVSSFIKDFCDSSGISVILLHHTNKGSESQNGKRGFGAFRGNGKIADDCDYVVQLQREFLEDGTTTPTLKVEKDRIGGRNGYMLPLFFNEGVFSGDAFA